MKSINRVVLTGGLTRDPQLRFTSSGTPVMAIRLGFTTRVRREGVWQERSNYADVELFGARARGIAARLERGRQVAVDGHLEWHEFETRDGRRRETLRIVADRIECLPRGHTEKPAAPAAAEKSAAEAPL